MTVHRRARGKSRVAAPEWVAPPTRQFSDIYDHVVDVASAEEND